MMKKVAVIAAAGDASRMSFNIPRQFMLLNQKPVLYYTIRSFLDAFEDIDIILVLPEDYIANGQEIIDGYFDDSRIKICTGGRTRFHSVKNGLAQIKEECIVFVHDGVRCLVKPELIRKCYEHALENGTAVPVVACNDSLRIINNEESNVLEKNKVKLVQTPQVFHSKILLPAYNIDYKDQFTDEAVVIEAFGLNVHLVEGQEDNIKITSLMDLFLAEKLLQTGEKVSAS